MTDRPYLSIGDVLSLLKEEFPDVTISKIRFLESQGLVDPERSPSGYRKFYDHDVDRLRWVLRQQRDQFLPLKVIRDRLAAAGNGVPLDDVEEPRPASGSTTSEPGEAWSNGVSRETAAGGGAGAASQGSSGTGVGGGAAGGSPGHRQEAGVLGRIEPEGANVVRLDAERRQASSGHPATLGASEGRGEGGDADSGGGPSELPTLERDEPGSARTGVHAPTEAQAGRPSGPAPAGARGRSMTRASAGGDAPEVGGLFAGSTGGAPPTAHTEAGRVGAKASSGYDVAWGGGAASYERAGAGSRAAGEQGSRSEAGGAAASGTSDPGRNDRAERGERAERNERNERSGRAGSTGNALSGSVSGVSLTLAELAAATGLSPQTLASLEGFGLIAPMAIAGETFYDEEALTAAKLVVEFAKFGIEPRHLRLYRNAVDRETGLVEQVITPLLRQRNPEARQRAMDASAELTRLGQSLRAALVRTEVRRLFGG